MSQPSSPLLRFRVLVALGLCALAVPAAAQPTPANLEPPKLKNSPQPVYPQAALDKRIEAVVVLDIDISEEGLVDGASVVDIKATDESLAPVDAKGLGFEDAATVAALQLEFEPAKDDGTPVAVRINYTVRFKLPPKPTPPPATPEPAGSTVETTGPPPAPARKPVLSLSGVLLERGTRALVVGATVTIYRGEGEAAEGFEATTDDAGRFQFFDLAPGEWKIQAEQSGYIPFKTTEVAAKGEVVEVKYYIERGSYNPYDVTIEAERPRKEVNRRTLQASEIERVPGTLGDPVLVIENLPGVARALGGQIIVRGSGPQDTGIFIDGSTVPLIYHFGGLKSVLPANVIESVDFYPGNYTVAYGRATGGVFDLHIKRLDPDRVHGSADVSVLDTSVYVEAPIGDDAAIAFAGRRSYIDFVLNAVIPDDADFSLTSAPRYYDYQFLGNWRPNRKHEVRWLFLGSDDLFEILFDDPSDVVGPGAQGNDVSATTNFQRATAEYRYTPSRTVKNRTKLAVGRDAINFSGFDLFRLQFDVYSAELRNGTTVEIDDHLSIEAGIDTSAGYFKGTVNAPPIPQEGEPEGEFDPDSLIFAKVDGNLFVFATYVEAQIKLGKLSLTPGLRFDYFGQVNELSSDPRIVARYDIDDRWAVKGGAAVVHQEPQIPDLSEAFGNPDLGLQKAYQYSVGGEWKPFDFLKADLTLFYKDMRDLVSSSNRVIERDGEMIAEVLNNGGKGRVYGLETFIEHKFAHNLRGWLSYTLSRAERRDFGKDEFRLFDFDQTHILAVVASYTLPKNWEVGLRWRLVTGSPFTPAIGGVFIDSIDEYTPIYGDINSGRLPMFQSLDLRVDKTWVFDTWKLGGYLSLINSYNHGNVESITYNFDYTEEGYIFGLPVLPILGVKGEW